MVFFHVIILPPCKKMPLKQNRGNALMQNEKIQRCLSHKIFILAHTIKATLKSPFYKVILQIYYGNENNYLKK